MKNRKNLFYIGMFTLCALGFAACSDEETYDVYGDPYNHVYLYDGGNKFNFVHTPVSSISTLDMELPLYCNHKSPKSFSALVEVDNSLVKAYNEANNTEYAEVPISALNIENGEVYFEQGSLVSSNALHITANENIADLRNSNGYVIPLRLVSATNDVKVVEDRATTYIFVNVSEDTDNIADEAVDPKGTLVQDRTGWTAIVPEGSTYSTSWNKSEEPDYMFSNSKEPSGAGYWYGRMRNQEFPVIINLGKAYTFDGMKAYYSYYNYENTTWTNRSLVEISNNGTDWESVGTLSNTNVTQTFYAPVTAQYIKITVPQSYSAYFRCSDFNIYAK